MTKFDKLLTTARHNFTCCLRKHTAMFYLASDRNEKVNREISDHLFNVAIYAHNNTFTKIEPLPDSMAFDFSALDLLLPWVGPLKEADLGDRLLVGAGSAGEDVRYSALSAPVNREESPCAIVGYNHELRIANSYRVTDVLVRRSEDRGSIVPATIPIADIYKMKSSSKVATEANTKILAILKAFGDSGAVCRQVKKAGVYMDTLITRSLENTHPGALDVDKILVRKLGARLRSHTRLRKSLQNVFTDVICVANGTLYTVDIERILREDDSMEAIHDITPIRNRKRMHPSYEEDEFISSRKKVFGGGLRGGSAEERQICIPLGENQSSDVKVQSNSYLSQSGESFVASSSELDIISSCSQDLDEIMPSSPLNRFLTEYLG